jgi:Transposase DDE domain group 1
MAQSIPEPIGFPTRAGVPLLARAGGGRLTSDGGRPWVAAADTALGLCRTRAHCIPDWRRGPVIHPLETRVRQRVYQIACGYEHQDDADTLRTDPLRKLVGGRLPDRGVPLASQPPMSRLEHHITGHTVERLATALVDRYLRERGRHGPPTQLGLDCDGTDDPAHGQQEGVAFHGYYDQHMEQPLLVFDGDTGHLITAVRRPGNVHASRFAVLVLRRVVRRRRPAWPRVALELRADSGFAIPRLDTWCAAHQVTLTIGRIPNPVLERLAAPLLADAAAQSTAAAGAKRRRVDAAPYQAGSWPTAQRVVFKAEMLAKGATTRLVVTTRTDPPLAVYDWYVDRGQSEHFITDDKHALAADRLSDHRFWANQFRLLLHAAAYWLLHTLRRWLATTEAAAWPFDTLRLRLLKIAGKVRECARLVWLHLASSHPSEPLWRHLELRPWFP